jgi:carboxypeptidase Taq
MTNSSYERLEPLFERVAHLANGERNLSWDRRTLMPPGGGETRAKVVSTLRTIANETLCSPQVRDLLDAAEADGLANLDPWQAANLREMRRIWRHVIAVPIPLQSAIAELAGPTERAWQSARSDNDFQSFVAPLRAYLELQTEASRIRGEAFGIAPYDALLDEHEPGLRTATIDPLFDDLASFLPDLVQRITAKQSRLSRPLPLEGPFPEHQQFELSRTLAALVGFDFEHGRLDKSAHPYTSTVPGDVRITTRFRLDDVREGIAATIHESGHAMYEAGLPYDWRFQPVGLARGGALHESQALLFEMQASRSTPFLRHLARLLRESFGGQGAAWTDSNVLRTYRQVAPGFTRIEADEATYPLHIILRYRIERRLVEGSLHFADIPDAWNATSKELLGVVPPTHALGCLQDPHWTMGYLGYFPVYTLGALIAAQCFATAKQAEPELMAALARGDFSPLIRWTRSHVHRLGSFPPTGQELITQATGEALSTRALKEHLVARYLEE